MLSKAHRKKKEKEKRRRTFFQGTKDEYNQAGGKSVSREKTKEKEKRSLGKRENTTLNTLIGSQP